MSKTAKRFIILSVLLNLLLAGIVAGHAVRFAMHARSWQEMAESLPPEKRQRFEAAMENVDHGNALLRDKLIAARRQATSLLKAHNFDKQAYLAQIDTIRQLHAEMMQRKAAAVAEAAADLTQQERAMLADSLRARPRPHKP